jgi:hypothetical protein
MFSHEQYDAFLEIFHRSPDWRDEKNVRMVVDAYWHSYLATTFAKRGLHPDQLADAGEIILRRFRNYEGKGNPIAYLISFRDKVAQEILEMAPLVKQRPPFSMEKLFANVHHPGSHQPTAGEDSA